MTTVAVVESNVLGVLAYHAECLSCGWLSCRYDHQSTAARHAAKHTHEETR